MVMYDSVDYKLQCRQRLIAFDAVEDVDRDAMASKSLIASAIPVKYDTAM